MRVVTINVKGVGSGWFEGRFGALVEGLRGCEPDVVCFQEAVVSARVEPYDQASDVARAIGLDAVAFAPYGNPDEPTTHDHFGVAVASRWPLRRVRSRQLPPGRHPPDARVVLLADMTAPGGDVRVVTTHLSWRPDEADVRVAQLRAVLDHFAAVPWDAAGARVVLAGDLNATDGEPVIALAAERLQDAWRARHPDAPGHTWVRDNPLTEGFALPDRRLDYVFCPRDAAVQAAEVVLRRAAPVHPSDHCGVLAELTFGAAATTR